MRDLFKEMWEYECACGHTTYFLVGGTQDIICHKCWNYSLTLKGKIPIDWDKYEVSQ